MTAMEESLDLHTVASSTSSPATIVPSSHSSLVPPPPPPSAILVNEVSVISSSSSQSGGLAGSTTHTPSSTVPSTPNKQHTPSAGYANYASTTASSADSQASASSNVAAPTTPATTATGGRRRTSSSSSSSSSSKSASDTHLTLHAGTSTFCCIIRRGLAALSTASQKKKNQLEVINEKNLVQGYLCMREVQCKLLDQLPQYKNRTEQSSRSSIRQELEKLHYEAVSADKGEIAILKAKKIIKHNAPGTSLYSVSQVCQFLLYHDLDVPSNALRVAFDQWLESCGGELPPGDGLTTGGGSAGGDGGTVEMEVDADGNAVPRLSSSPSLIRKVSKPRSRPTSSGGGRPKSSGGSSQKKKQSSQQQRKRVASSMNDDDDYDEDPDYDERDRERREREREREQEYADGGEHSSNGGDDDSSSHHHHHHSHNTNPHHLEDDEVHTLTQRHQSSSLHQLPLARSKSFSVAGSGDRPQRGGSAHRHRRMKVSTSNLTQQYQDADMMQDDDAGGYNDAQHVHHGQHTSQHHLSPNPLHGGGGFRAQHGRQRSYSGQSTRTHAQYQQQQQMQQGYQQHIPNMNGGGGGMWNISVNPPNTAVDMSPVGDRSSSGVIEPYISLAGDLSYSAPAPRLDLGMNGRYVAPTTYYMNHGLMGSNNTNTGAPVRTPSNQATMNTQNSLLLNSAVSQHQMQQLQNHQQQMQHQQQHSMQHHHQHQPSSGSNHLHPSSSQISSSNHRRDSSLLPSGLELEAISAREARDARAWAENQYATHAPLHSGMIPGNMMMNPMIKLVISPSAGIGGGGGNGGNSSASGPGSHLIGSTRHIMSPTSPLTGGLSGLGAMIHGHGGPQSGSMSPLFPSSLGLSGLGASPLPRPRLESPLGMVMKDSSLGGGVTVGLGSMSGTNLLSIPSSVHGGGIGTSSSTISVGASTAVTTDTSLAMDESTDGLMILSKSPTRSMAASPTPTTPNRSPMHPSSTAATSARMSPMVLMLPQTQYSSQQQGHSHYITTTTMTTTLTAGQPGTNASSLPPSSPSLSSTTSLTGIGLSGISTLGLGPSTSSPSGLNLNTSSSGDKTPVRMKSPMMMRPFPFTSLLTPQGSGSNAGSSSIFGSINNNSATTTIKSPRLGFGLGIMTPSSLNLGIASSATSTSLTNPLSSSLKVLEIEKVPYQYQQQLDAKSHIPVSATILPVGGHNINNGASNDIGFNNTLSVPVRRRSLSLPDASKFDRISEADAIQWLANLQTTNPSASGTTTRIITPTNRAPKVIVTKPMQQEIIAHY